MFTSNNIKFGGNKILYLKYSIKIPQKKLKKK